MKFLLAIGTAALLASGAAACSGSGGQHSGSALGDAAGAASSVAGAGHQARPHPLSQGDYDDDDYRLGYYDYDPDDNTLVKDQDGDVDGNRSHSFYDEDDNTVRRFGHPATAGERRAIVALAGRYYPAQARDDGAAICAMTVRGLAQSYSSTIGEAGPQYFRGLHSCAQIMTKAMARLPQMPAFASRMTVVNVRVDGEVGLAVIRAKSFHTRVLEAHLEGKRWVLYGSLDHELP
jgi:hypothetical protein